MKKKTLDDEELFIPKKKHIFLKIIIVIFIIGLFIGGGYYYYKNYYSNPKKIFEVVTESIEKNLSNKKELKSYELNGLITFNFDLGKEYQNTTDIINNLSLQLNNQIDSQNNIILSTINTKYKDKKLIDLKTYNVNDNLYFYLENMFDKYIKINKHELIDETYSDNKDSINVIIRESLTTVKDKMNNLEFYRKEDTIIINNQKYNVNNNYIKLKNGEINSFLLDILNELLNNQKFMNALNKLSNNEGKEILEDTIKQIRNDTIVATYQLSFYTKKNFNQDLISIKQFIEQNEEYNVVEINFVNENNYNFKIYDKEISLEINLMEKENTFNIDIHLNLDNQKISIITIFNYNEISSIEKTNIENSIDINNLTEDDYNTIVENLSQNDTLLEIYEKFKNINNNFT